MSQINLDNLPRASRYYENAPTQKVVKGDVKVVKNKQEGKLAGLIFNDAFKVVLDQTLYNTVIPTIKDTLIDLLDRVFDVSIRYVCGDDYREPTRGRNNHIAYNSIYNSRNAKPDNVVSFKNKPASIVEDVLCQDKNDANELIASMLDYLREYGSVSVADLYDMIGKTKDHVCSKWMWTNEAQFARETRIIRLNNGYWRVDFPKPKYTDR